MKKLLAALTLLTGVALMSIGAVQSANAAAGGTKILICHRTLNANKPYQVISVSASANGYGHHAQHGGPLGTPELIASLSKPYGQNAWGDVLPPATIDGTNYPGQNWFDQKLVKGDPSTCIPAVATTPVVTTPAATTPAVPHATVAPTLPATGGDASKGLLVAGGLLAAAGVVALGGAQLAGRRRH